MKKGSQTAYTCERKAQRFPLDRGDEPFVEFALEDGSFWQFSLLDVSAAGIAFALDDERISLPVGTKFDKATVRIGTSFVDGSMRVVHLTPKSGVGIVCGAGFSPLAKKDEGALSRLIARLEKRGDLSG